MIICDLNQIMIANIMAQLHMSGTNQIELDMVRHMIINSLRNYKVKFSNEFGEMVIATDTSNYWRRSLFPYYKKNRKVQMDKSDIDWKAIFEALNTVREEIRNIFPYRVISVDSAEADDIIAVLVKKFNQNEKILILSSDKDFLQLQRFDGVSQYDPLHKRPLSTSNPSQFLLEHIFKGDRGDGIPNVLSRDDSYINSIRQKPITSKRIKAWTGFNGTPSAEFINICENDPQIKKNFERNQKLIDLSLVPQNIEDEIERQYSEQSNKNRSKLLNYFIENKMRHMIEALSDF